jgi:hypothetical protein
MPHQYILFENIPGVTYDLPVVRDVHWKTYLKPDVGPTFMVGIFEGDPLPSHPEVVKRRNASNKGTEREACNELYDDSI